MDRNERSRMSILPLVPGACEECGSVHPKDGPHNWGAPRYQYNFLDNYGCWPSWGDAIAHMPEVKRLAMEAFLLESGVLEGELKPNKPKEDTHESNG